MKRQHAYKIVLLARDGDKIIGDTVSFDNTYPLHYKNENECFLEEISALADNAIGHGHSPLAAMCYKNDTLIRMATY